MDTDWCLSCGRRVDNAAPYCSQECLSFDHPQPHTVMFSLNEFPSESASTSSKDFPEFAYSEPAPEHSPTSWVTLKGKAGIAAWAADVPLGSPVENQVAPIATTPTRPVRTFPARSPKPKSAVSPSFRPPVLLLPLRRPTPPTLCMSIPQSITPFPSLPVCTPQQQTSLATLELSESTSPNMREKSLPSARTESLVATPSSPLALALPASVKRSVFGTLATHVKSWVSPCPQLPYPLLHKHSASLRREESTTPAPMTKRFPLASTDSSRTSSLTSSLIDEPRNWWDSGALESHSSTESLLRNCLMNELACASRGRPGSRQIVV